MINKRFDNEKKNKNDFENFFVNFTMTLKKTTKNIYLLDDSDLIHNNNFYNKCKCQSHERKIAH